MSLICRFPTLPIAYRAGQAVRLGDPGRVTISHQDRTMAIRSHGQDAVAVTIFRRLGLSPDDALVRAGRTRFRPILMTSLATILGLAPLALGLGPGAQMQQPLAIAVIGGLIANMLLTRLLIPVGYLVVQGRRTAACPRPATPD